MGWVYSQDLKEAEDANTVVAAKDGDEVVKEPSGPGELGQEEKNALEDDEDVVDDRKHGTTGLKRHTMANSQFLT